MNKEKEKQEQLIGLVPVANKGQELIPHKDYEIKQDGEKFYLVKKKKEYPKTYEECCKVLEIEGNSLLINTKHITDYERDLGNLMGQFHRLIICRDAYWKIAGEEMGLGKPWKPRWNDSYQKKWIINFYQDEINLTNGPNVHFVLAFPTEEMRDAFDKNFGPDLNKCKELI